MSIGVFTLQNLRETMGLRRVISGIECRANVSLTFSRFWAIFRANMMHRVWWLASSLATLTTSSEAQSAGPLQRVPNTTLQMPTNPPSHGFTAATALGGLVFSNPVVIANPPDETNRLFIVEKKGRIVVITN